MYQIYIFYYFRWGHVRCQVDLPRVGLLLEDGPRPERGGPGNSDRVLSYRLTRAKVLNDGQVTRTRYAAEFKDKVTPDAIKDRVPRSGVTARGRTDDFSAALNSAVEALDGVGRVQLGPVGGRKAHKAHVGEHVSFCASISAASSGTLGRS